MLSLQKALDAATGQISHAVLPPPSAVLKECLRARNTIYPEASSGFCFLHVLELSLILKKNRVSRRTDWIVTLLKSNPGFFNDPGICELPESPMVWRGTKLIVCYRLRISMFRVSQSGFHIVLQVEQRLRCKHFVTVCHFWAKQCWRICQFEKWTGAKNMSKHVKTYGLTIFGESTSIYQLFQNMSY